MYKQFTNKKETKKGMILEVIPPRDLPASRPVFFCLPGDSHRAVGRCEDVLLADHRPAAREAGQAARVLLVYGGNPRPLAGSHVVTVHYLVTGRRHPATGCKQTGHHWVCLFVVVLSPSIIEGHIRTDRSDITIDVARTQNNNKQTDQDGY